MSYVTLPDYVYAAMNKYGNAALPNYANKYTKQQLTDHFTNKLKRPVSLYKARFGLSDDKYQEYWIASVKCKNLSKTEVLK